MYQMKEWKNVSAAFGCHPFARFESPSRLGLLFFPAVLLSVLCYLITVLCLGLYAQGPCLILAPLFPLGSRSRWPLITAEFN